MTVFIFFDAVTRFRYLLQVREPIARIRNRSWPAIIAIALALAFSNISASGDDKLRVVGMDVRVELRPELGLISETARITVEGSSGPVVRFRLNRGLLVERIQAGTGVAGYSQTGDTVSVTLAPAMENERRTLTFKIAGRPHSRRDQPVSPQGALLGAGEQWIPTLPNITAEADLEVVAPAGWTVLASGEPVSGQPASVHRFRSRQPVRAIGLAAGPGLTVTTATMAGTPLRVAGDVGRDAGALAKVFSDPLTWFSGTVAPYPFEGLNLVFVSGLDRPVYGGGFIAIPVDQAPATLAGGADLLSSLWFGQYLAGDGPWIGSLAAWQAVSYARDRGQGLPPRIASQRDRYLAISSNRDAALRRADDDTPEEVIRGKGSAAWDMIRLTCGNRHFQARLGALIASGPGEVLSLEKVRGLFEEGSPEQVKTVFSDWFDRTGLPGFTTRLRTSPTSRNEWRTDLTIQQRGRPYTATMDVVFHGSGREHRETVRIDRETSQLLYILPFQALRVELDPLGRIFKQPTITRKR
jgi:hypothetical protein